MSIREDIAKKMRADIAFGVQNYGLESPLYWEYIETLARTYWSDFDRHTIFDIYNISE